MGSRTLTTEQVLALLAAGPGRLEAAAAGVPAEVLTTRPAPEAWSANEVLAHLRSCADVWGRCIEEILDGRTTLRAVNPRTWISRTDYLELPYAASLRAFTEQRSRLLALLEPLPEDGWARGATVTGAGRPLERTVGYYAQWLATHERPHLKQVERALAQVSA